MKILHVITSLQTGGAEHLLVDLLPGLRSKGHDVELCIFYGEKTSFYEELETEGIKIHVLSMNKNVYDWKLIPKLHKLMKNYDVVHTHITAPQFFAAFAKPKGTKIVTTEHSTSTRRRKYRIFRNIDRWMYRQYDHIICISKPSEDSLRNYLGGSYDIETIQNGVNVRKFLSATPVDLGLGNKKVIMMVAAFRYEKDQPTVIRSLHHLPNDYHLVLVGGGAKKMELADYIKKEGLQDRVHMIGIRKDVANVLKSADVVVMSSHREGLSLSNVEGMSSGNPFVASDVEGLREVTKGYGLLFPHGDDVALAEIILKLCEDSELSQEVAKRCQERAMQYDISKMVDGYNRVYINL